MRVGIFFHSDFHLPFGGAIVASAFPCTGEKNDALSCVIKGKNKGKKTFGVAFADDVGSHRQGFSACLGFPNNA